MRSCLANLLADMTVILVTSRGDDLLVTSDSGQDMDLVQAEVSAVTGVRWLMQFLVSHNTLNMN